MASAGEDRLRQLHDDCIDVEESVCGLVVAREMHAMEVSTREHPHLLASATAARCSVSVSKKTPPPLSVLSTTKCRFDSLNLASRTIWDTIQ